MRDIFAGFVAMKLHGVDETFVKQVFREGSGVVHEDADARDFSGEGGKEFPRGGGWAVAFRFFPKIDADGVDAEPGELSGFVGAGDPADFESGSGLRKKCHGLAGGIMRENAASGESDSFAQSMNCFGVRWQ